MWLPFIEEKYVSFLIFPKSLTAFKTRRVIGIKYDTLKQADVSTPLATSAPKRSVRPTTPKPKPKPRPKRFTATVRRVATNEFNVTVEAFDEAEARVKLEAAARKKTDVPPPRIETELISVSAGKGS